MTKVSCISLFIILLSCGQHKPGVDTGEDTEIDGSDTITEFDMSEERLSAVDFNNELTLMQESLLDQMETLFLSDSASVDLNLENTLFEIDLSKQSLEAMKAPDNSEGFLTAMKNLLNFYEAELTTGFSEIVPLLKMQTLTKKQQQQLSDYDLTFAEQEKAWFDTVFLEQEKFAVANNIKLE
jgi:hypothetical protein